MHRMSPASFLSCLPRLVLACGMLVLVADNAQAQGQPPADGIQDDARAISSEMHQQLAGELQQFREDLKCDAWITASSFTPTSVTVRRQAQVTRRAWSGDRPAVLMAYDRASDSTAFSFSPVLWERYSAAHLVEIMQETRRIFSDRGLALDERFALATRQWTERLREMEAVRLRQSLFLQSDERRFAKLIVMLLSGGALVAAILGYASRRHAAISERQHLLPDVEVAMRLGAPCGGGVMVETSAASMTT